ncbi:MAG: 30S ribosomal protein S8 [Atribacterota bacterium]|jgi:small subunit ribosomal protein S8|nr:30S ribosomal protein S8 [Atribacterota bacterium]MDD4896670.1 30S ribosomal protein S8 [Atribacterota bacterium]MDD5636417.1 30S ribosomal protein S8 [Atribacterota bacterium]
MGVVSDPIADIITRIRNANRAKLEKIEIPSSKIKLDIARILKEEGYILDFYYKEDNKQGIIIVLLKYSGKQRIITNLKRISKPGLRVYVNKDDVPEVLGGLGVSILSTSKGIMTGREAKKRHFGGEVLCYIW